jgi:transglutaminase-like putative cysteine protease
MRNDSVPPASNEHAAESTSVYLAPAEYIDSDHPTIRRQVSLLGVGQDDHRRAARVLYTFVRDLPYRIEDFGSIDTYRASAVLAREYGYCVPKAGLLAALCRATGIPARVAFADVQNHLASPRLLRLMGTDTFAWHGYTELWLGGRWVHVSPTFDRETCDRLGVPPLPFDGTNDALLQAFTGGGTMTYRTWHGAFHDIPARFLQTEMPRRYARVYRAVRRPEQIEAPGSAAGR